MKWCAEAFPSPVFAQSLPDIPPIPPVILRRGLPTSAVLLTHFFSLFDPTLFFQSQHVSGTPPALQSFADAGAEGFAIQAHVGRLTLGVEGLL